MKYNVQQGRARPSHQAGYVTFDYRTKENAMENANEGRTFSLATVLTVTTGRLVAEDGIAAVYEILNYMTRDNLFTHQLPRASGECKPWLLRWHPKLAEVRMSLLDKFITASTSKPDRSKDEACKLWVDFERGRLGLPTELLIQRIPQDDHERKDPYDELVVRRGTDEGIVLVAPAPSEGA
jgi:hypothetical protein